MTPKTLNYIGLDVRADTWRVSPRPSHLLFRLWPTDARVVAVTNKLKLRAIAILGLGGKAKRVRATLSWGIDNAPDRAEAFVAALIGLIRGKG